MNIPFKYNELKNIMRERAIDLAVANSRHNVRYLLGGGYFYHFHEHSTRMAQSQYLPLVGIPGSGVDGSFYIHRPDEAG
jgi:hypothetical protein